MELTLTIITILVTTLIGVFIVLRVGAKMRGN